jgi:hypothetical protein
MPVIDETWSYRWVFSIPSQYYGTPEGIDAHTLIEMEPAWAARYMGDYRIIKRYAPLIRSYLSASWEANQILAPLRQRYRTWERTSVHIRRGDYVGNGFYQELGAEYYEPLPDNALIFTDDPGYAAATYPGVEVVEPNADWTDLLLMSSCSSHVIANSSFSWWAAFLSGNATVCPSRFFSDTSGMPDQSHNILDHWEIR